MAGVSQPLEASQTALKSSHSQKHVQSHTFASHSHEYEVQLATSRDFACVMSDFNSSDWTTALPVRRVGYKVDPDKLSCCALVAPTNDVVDTVLRSLVRCVEGGLAHCLAASKTFRHSVFDYSLPVWCGELCKRPPNQVLITTSRKERSVDRRLVTKFRALQLFVDGYAVTRYCKSSGCGIPWQSKPSNYAPKTNHPDFTS